MADFNKVILVGRLTRDLQSKPVGNSTVVEGGLATGRKYKTKDGEQREETTFVDFSVWGAAGENMAKYAGKGSKLLIEGRLKLDQWDDKQTGDKRSKLSVVVDNYSFLDTKKSESGGNDGDSGGDGGERRGYSRPFGQGSSDAKSSATAGAGKIEVTKFGSDGKVSVVESVKARRAAEPPVDRESLLGTPSFTDEDIPF